MTSISFIIFRDLLGLENPFLMDLWMKYQKGERVLTQRMELLDLV